VSINLLPAELASAHRRPSKRPMLLTAFLSFGCFFLIANGFLYFKVHALDRQTEYWDLIQVEVNWAQERLEQLEEEIVWANEELNALATILNESIKHTEIIGILQYHLNSQVSLQQIVLSEEGWLVIRGQTKTMASIGELTASLSSDAYFLEVNVAELYQDSDGNHSFTLELLTHGRTDGNEI
jgi:hypothetical protein